MLIIGDAHIPRRAKEISPQIIDKLTQTSTDKLFEYTFFTGDLVNAEEFIQFLKLRTKKDVFVVIGNMDYYEGNRNLPTYQKLEYSLNKDNYLLIGLTHGHQISPRGDHSQLELLAVENGYNILISGHTHKEEIFLTKDGVLLLNPGSITGAWSFISSGIPSFMVLSISKEDQGIIVELFQFNIKESKFIESKFHFIFKNQKITRKF
ncbi:MAG: YfcE family phosphodiesterase [Candidatus Thorarchaeota archaeon]